MTTLDKLGIDLWRTIGELEELKKLLLTSPKELEQLNAICTNASAFLKRMEEL